MSGQPTLASGAIAAIGRDLGPAVLAQCLALFAGEQGGLAQAMPPVAVDLPYGPDPRHRLDLYAPPAVDGATGLPVLVFVHGGGFRLGDKGGGERWANANVGRMAARAGLVGVVVNYRLAPEHRWPAGGEDVGIVVEWLHRHVAAYSGDPARIVLVGTSAGAVHVATHLQLRGDADIAGAALLSGFYGCTPLEERDIAYFGDPALYAGRQPLAAVAASPLPLFVACAEYDPPRFHAEYAGLLRQRLDQHGHLPPGGVVAGHNHYSLTLHLGTGDRRLADALVAFACTL